MGKNKKTVEEVINTPPKKKPKKVAEPKEVKAKVPVHTSASFNTENEPQDFVPEDKTKFDMKAITDKVEAIITKHYSTCKEMGKKNILIQLSKRWE